MLSSVTNGVSSVWLAPTPRAAPVYVALWPYEQLT